MQTALLIDNPLPAFAYVVYQEFKNLYTPEKGIKQGTIFKDLDIPFSEYKNNPIMNPFKG